MLLRYLVRGGLEATTPCLRLPPDDGAIRARALPPPRGQPGATPSQKPRRGHCRRGRCHPGRAIPGEHGRGSWFPWEGPAGDSPEAGGEGQAGQETQRALRAGVGRSVGPPWKTSRFPSLYSKERSGFSCQGMVKGKATPCCGVLVASDARDVSVHPTCCSLAAAGSSPSNKLHWKRQISPAL